MNRAPAVPEEENDIYFAGAISQASSVSDRVVELTYNANNDIHEYQYTYDNRGLMTMRKDAKIKQFESFTYDNLDRLLTFHRGTTTSAGDAVTHTRNMSYDNTGNITSYNQLGNYDYSGYGPHAVSMVSLHEAAPMGILASQCDVNYNAFNKPTRITEGDYQLNLFYGADGIRHKSILQQNGNTVKTTCFVGDLYEKETVDGVTRHLNYIYAGGQIVAINIQQDNTDNMYYVHTDHLGNYNVITDQNKTVCQRFHFDPWGNRTQYRSWHLPDNTAMPITTRGFTGHEHLSEFNIINMKGRLYDPVIARFFSPDPFVQAPEFTQGFNRYSYCLNNPLKYIDPTGELFTKFLDKDGNVIMDVDDGSNAVFQVTGTDATKDYFKFIGWDDQSGVNKINLSGLIAGSQDYVMNSFTKCNQAVNFVGRTYNAVLEQMGTRAESGYIVNQNFLANEISQQLLNSQIFSYEKTEEGIKSAQVAAEAGNLVIGTASGHVNMLTTGTFNITRYQNGTTTTFSYQSGQVANVNGRTTTSIGPDKNLGPNQNNSYYPIKNSHITALYPIYREIRVRFLLPTIFVYP